MSLIAFQGKCWHCGHDHIENSLLDYSLLNYSLMQAELIELRAKVAELTSTTKQDDVRKDAERWKFVTGENGYCVCKYNDSPYGAGYVPVDVETIDKARE